MKKIKTLLSSACLTLMPAVVFAQEVLTVAVPVQTSGMDAVIKAVSAIVLLALLPLLAFGVAYLMNKIAEAKANTKSAGMQTAFVLAGAGVAIAKQQFGPDTEAGRTYQKALVDQIMKVSPALDRPAVELMIQGLYAAPFTVLSPLAPLPPVVVLPPSTAPAK